MRSIIVSAIVLGLLGGCPSGGTKAEPAKEAPAEGAEKKKRGGKKKEQPPAEAPAAPEEPADSDAEH